jgi:hypothetical protein
VIDFDTARPGPRRWDLAYALYRFAPLADPGNPDSVGDAEDQARRARMFLDVYGCGEPERADAVELVPDRLRWLVTLMRERAAEGDLNFIRHIEEGHADLYLRDIAYVESHRADWHRLVVQGATGSAGHEGGRR